jgi:hypothetical protein
MNSRIHELNQAVGGYFSACAGEDDRGWHKIADDMNEALLLVKHHIPSSNQVVFRELFDRIREFEHPYLEWRETPKMRRYRFSKLLQICGRPVALEKAAPEHAVQPNILCIHHGESPRDRFVGLPGTSCFNVAGHACFPRPIPDDCYEVIGIEQHAEAGMF